MDIKITGKSKNVSKAQVRSFVCACYCVFMFHKMFPKPGLKIVFKKGPLMGDPACGGYYNTHENYMVVNDNLTIESTLSVITHEFIHSVKLFPIHTLEKCTSTLTGRIKEDISKIAQILVDGTYKRAAYLAHTSISYVAKGGDHYDFESQEKPVGIRKRCELPLVNSSLRSN